ncbi:hypothetical protein LX99_03719 [Mucilaginibacter oryzae]|uniref:Uncharacterized protein n=1 Tax=Mucilaginibacter oryzae TaxID=468058 RepID=A0A316HCD9_9SPHI|nr:hypothetical protein LX99_03719 [Mucilaginibacter oryzae]
MVYRLKGLINIGNITRLNFSHMPYNQYVGQHLNIANGDFLYFCLK